MGEKLRTIDPQRWETVPITFKTRFTDENGYADIFTRFFINSASTSMMLLKKNFKLILKIKMFWLQILKPPFIRYKNPMVHYDIYLFIIQFMIEIQSVRASSPHGSLFSLEKKKSEHEAPYRFSFKTEIFSRVKTNDHLVLYISNFIPIES